MPILNLGIVAHVDAGKTTLTERLLFETGVTKTIGRVDHGDTVTDTDELERSRGITIRSAVVTFNVGNIVVNLIDTPGHSDFVAEVERALAVLDGAVLVVSAVEGVQAQTRVLIRILERLRIPFLIFANKIDRAGAAYETTMTAIRDALAGEAVALTRPSSLGDRSSTVNWAAGRGFLDDLVERLAEYDDQVLSRYVDGRQPLTEHEALRELARLTAEGVLHPVYFGAALNGVGVAELGDGLRRYLPAGALSADGPLHASVFKIERATGGRKVAFARLHTGTLAARDRVVCYSGRGPGAVIEREVRVTSVATFASGTATRGGPAHAGEIAKIGGLDGIGIGDQLGRWDPTRGRRYVAPPGLESVVVARNPADRPALFQALGQLCEQDPLIAARLDGVDDELTVSLYGEIQKEVLAARLASEFGVDAEFLPTQTVYIERLAGVGRALRVIGTLGNRDLATVGLRVQPGVAGSGIGYAREVELGGLLLSFHTAIEDTVGVTLQEGRYGWRVTDCVVTLTHSGYWAPVSTAGDFRRVTAAVLRDAVRDAGTTVCAPVSLFEVDIPADTTSAVLQKLHAAGAAPQAPEPRAARCRITGTIPSARVHGFERRLPGLTRGEGFLFSSPAGYEPVHGSPPVRRGRSSADARASDSSARLSPGQEH